MRDEERYREALAKYGERRIKELLKAYQRAQREILDQVTQQFERTAKEGTWDWSEMQKYDRAKKLFDRIGKIIKQLGEDEEKDLKGILRDTYREELVRKTIQLAGSSADLTNYGTSHRQLLDQTGVGFDLSLINTRSVDEVLFHPWSGANFSQRIWQEKDRLIQTMRQELTQSMIQGESMYKAAMRVRDKMGNSAYNCMRLARTEIMRTSNDAHIKAYTDEGVEKVQWLATKDERTCPICAPLDMKTYPIDKHPIMPAHPHCRCTWLPVLDEDDDSHSDSAQEQKPEKGGIIREDAGAKAQAIVDGVDTSDREALAKELLHRVGLDHINVVLHAINNRGQCTFDASTGMLKFIDYFLQRNDNRRDEYRIKTVFHEFYHALADGLTHDLPKLGGVQNWAMVDDVFAECAAHALTKRVGITHEIMPAYPKLLVRALPMLKKLPEFQGCSTIADFGEVALKYRFSQHDRRAEWKDIFDHCYDQSFDILSYGQQYKQYVFDHLEEVAITIQENMPSISLANIKIGVARGWTTDLGNDAFIDSLIVAMNRQGVK